ncbi:MAG: nuclease [Verrucomicrobia bacterium]|nr:nuclease [Verrucomicrobiota bacterium]
MEKEAGSVGESITVVADDRENVAPVIAALRAIPGVEVICRRLKLGDYQIGHWIFERKTLRDLIESIIEGRLFSQANRLAAAGQPAAIILEGRTADLSCTQMRRQAIQGALISLSLIFELPVLRSFDAAETARLLVYAGQQLRRQGTDKTPRHGRRPKRRRKLQLYVLQGLPGIGSEKAERLLDHFGSVQAVMVAPEAELRQVRGIGERLAHGIRWVLGPDEPPGSCVPAVR